MVSTAFEALPTDEQSPNPWCGCLLSWRYAGGNRQLYKVLCTCGLIANVGIYVYLRQAFPVMVAIGVMWLLKNLVAIWGQDTPTFLVPGTPATFVLVYVIGIPSIVWMLIGCPVTGEVSFPYRDIIGLALFVFGNGYSFAYEFGRFRWKALAENKGHCHTVGLARLCIHPNYLGDLFAYSGWALAGGTMCALSLTGGQIAMFLWVVVPNADAYLAERYGDEFRAYAKKTATLIPFVHARWLNQVLACVGLATSIYASLYCSDSCPAERNETW